MARQNDSDLMLQPGYWQSRLFKNTYTRAGRAFKVKGWSVKIQYRGRRRTFTFSSVPKAEAARRSLLVYKAIRAYGWDGVNTVHSTQRNSTSESAFASPAQDEFRPTDIRHWEARLIHRKYPRPPAGASGFVLSARVNHHDLNSWFPLDTDLPNLGAKKALEIYLTAAEKGWETACKRFSREVNLAVHWTANPTVWTYTTFHTATANVRLPKSSVTEKSVPSLSVALIEPEDGIRRALAYWISRQPGIQQVATFATSSDALRRASLHPNTLWLINHTLREMTGTECWQRLEKLDPTSCGLIYSIYEDSELLFASSPGGAAAYFYKRTLPDKILEPILNGHREEPLSKKRITLLVQQYFQIAVASVLPSESMLHLQRLTHREAEILQFLSKGYLDKEIAGKLGISTWTVHGHVKKIFEKLQVHTRTEAVVKYLQK